MKSIKVFMCIFILTSITCIAHAEKIFHNKVESAQSEYFVNLIKLALKNSAYAKKYELEENSITLNQQQAKVRLDDGRISLMWAGTTPEYEEDLTPIRIPLLKGLQGHRIFIIHKDQQSRFERVNNLTDLQKLKAGQGRFWADAAILKNSGLPVVTTTKKENLFYMVDGGRFDYFPLAVHEPWSEVDKREGLELTIDKKVLLVYPTAIYFFTSKQNAALAKVLEEGLNIAIENGQFDELFYSTPHINSALEYANLAERKVIRIENPNLTPQTPLDRKELWLDVTESKETEKFTKLN